MEQSVHAAARIEAKAAEDSCVLHVDFTFENISRKWFGLNLAFTLDNC